MSTSSAKTMKDIFVPNTKAVFGRDYYIREAKRAAGGRQKFLNEDGDGGEGTSTTENNENIFVAIPAIVHEEESQEEVEDEVTELESVPSSSRPVSLALSTDSEDIKVYNIETGKILTYKTKDYTKEIIEDAKSPEGTKSLICSNELISPNLPQQSNSKFDENQNHSTETNREPIMNISKLNHIINLSTDVKPKVNHPTTPISKKEFLLQQISYTEPEIEIEEDQVKAVVTPEMRDASKKYLQSLVRNNTRSKNIIDVSTPPVSIQEFEDLKPVENEKPAASLLPSIEIEENVVHNLIEIETEDTTDSHVNNKSCIDLRFIRENENNLSTDHLLLNGFASSTPNLSNDQLYYSDNDERVEDKKISDLEELDALPKPSVRDLKKLFDQDKQNKTTLSRSTSNLTTKPEFNAHRQIHSLTARNIPKEYRRDILPKLQDTKTTNDAIIEKQDQEEKPTIITEEELNHLPPCKSKIEFFEKLKK